MASTDPGVAFRLRPLSVGDLIDEALKLFRTDFRLYLLLMLLPLLPVGLISILMAAMFGDVIGSLQAGGRGANPLNTLQPGNFVGLGGLGLLLVLCYFVGYALASGGITYAVAQRYLGRRVTVEQALSVVRERLVALLIAPLLVGFMAFLAFGILTAIAVALGIGAAMQGANNGGNPGAVFGLFCLGFLVVVPLMIWIGVRLTLMNVAIVLENLGPWGGIRRSWSLVAGHWWRSFLTLFVVSMLVGVIGAIPGWIGAIVGAAMGSGSVAGVAIQYLFQFVGQVLVTPITLISIVLLYYDLRVRKEGFDLEMMAQQLRGDAPMPPATGMSPPSTAPW